MPIWTFVMKYPAEEPGFIICRECTIQAFYKDTALQTALLEAHKFAQENNIPFYRVEPKETQELNNTKRGAVGFGHTGE